MKVIRLTENKLYKIIRNTVKRILKENDQSEINDIYNSKNLTDMENTNPLLNKVWGNGFTLKRLISFKTYEDRIDYCKQTLDFVGSGERRVCFRLNDKYVLKVTRGEHRWQTKNEYDTTFLMNGIDIFTHTIYQSPDFTWSIVEYARPMTEEDCERILGIPQDGLNPNEPSLQGFQLWAQTKGRQKQKQLDRFPYSYYAVQKNNCEEFYRKLAKEHPWFKQLYKLEISQRSNLLQGTDLNDFDSGLRTSAFGVLKRNGKDTIVISDFGFIKPFPFEPQKVNPKNDSDIRYYTFNGKKYPTYNKNYHYNVSHLPNVNLKHKNYWGYY